MGLLGGAVWWSVDPPREGAGGVGRRLSSDSARGLISLPAVSPNPFGHLFPTPAPACRFSLPLQVGMTARSSLVPRACVLVDRKVDP